MVDLTPEQEEQMKRDLEEQRAEATALAAKNLKAREEAARERARKDGK